MKAKRSLLRMHSALALTASVLWGIGTSQNAEAAKFPTHIYFWLDNGNNPVNFTPWSEYSMCMVNGYYYCSVKVTENPNGNVGFYNLYDMKVSGVANWAELGSQTLIFASAYGETSTPSHPRYCTSGGTMGFDEIVNCSEPTNVSVRLVGNNGVTDHWRYVNAGGKAAFGSYATASPITFNSDGNTNEVTQVRVDGVAQPGRYKVVIPFDDVQADVSSAIAHVQAVQPPILNSYQQKRICTIYSLTKKSAGNSRAAEMEVRCYGKNERIETAGMAGIADLTPINTPFNYIYEYQNGYSSGLLRSVWSDRLVNGIYTPTHSSHAGITVQRIGTGRYTVYLPNTRPTKTNAQVTAYGSGARWCNILSWTAAGNGTDVKVACFKMSSEGAIATDSKFFLGYYYEENSL